MNLERNIHNNPMAKFRKRIYCGSTLTDCGGASVLRPLVRFPRPSVQRGDRVF